MRIQCPARSQPGGPDCLPLPAGHDIVVPHRLPGGFGYDVGAHELGQGRGQLALLPLDC